jgi:hypothetical protein
MSRALHGGGGSRLCQRRLPKAEDKELEAQSSRTGNAPVLAGGGGDAGGQRGMAATPLRTPQCAGWPPAPRRAVPGALWCYSAPRPDGCDAREHMAGNAVIEALRG